MRHKGLAPNPTTTNINPNNSMHDKPSDKPIPKPRASAAPPRLISRSSRATDSKRMVLNWVYMGSLYLILLI